MTLSIFDKKLNEKVLYQVDITKPDEVIRQLKEHYDCYDNLRTRSIKMSLTKKYFIENKVKKSITDNITPGKSITQAVKDMNEESLSNKCFVKLSFKNIFTILNHETEKKRLELLAIKLMIITGRRIGEILNGDFKKSKHDLRKVLFKGILKKRNTNNEYIKINTIVSQKRTLNLYHRFKALLEYKLNNMGVGVKVSTVRMSIQRSIKKILVNYNISTSHQLRVIYANYMFKRNNPNNKIYNSLIAEVLNHKGLNTSINYTTIQIE